VIEDELRSLLTERAGGVPDNPTRSAEIHSRIRTFRRRRIAGAALSLVLVVLASVLVVRWPGSNESLPPAVPAPPYFTAAGVPGYSSLAAPVELDRAFDRLLTTEPGDFRYLVVARCVRVGKLTVRNLVTGRSLEVSCERPVSDHFEGAAGFDAAAAEALLAQGSDAGNVRFEPGADGQEVAVLMSNAPDRLRPDPGYRPLAAGKDATVEITIPGVRGPQGYDALDLSIECVAGVRIAFSVPAGPLGTADCDPLRRNHMVGGRVSVGVSRAELDRLRLRTGQRVPLTIRSVGRDTDQWRVFPVA
jgi:hypothetical protein